MEPRLVILDGYNVILRSPRLKPGPNRTLRESREKLVNLLSWMMGSNDIRFVVVFDGEAESARAETGGRVEIHFSRPPEKADDVIARMVEQKVGGDESITVVTSDIEVARHARAQGAEVSIADLFLASALGDVGRESGDGKGSGADAEQDEKPAMLSKKELAQWADLFARRRSGTPETGAEPGADAETLN